MMEPTIERYMTEVPYTVGQRQSLADAHRLMNEHGIRHLPVLEDGKLVGIVSQRDLHFIETLQDVNPKEVMVSEAMTAEVFTVTRRSTVRKAAAEMAEHKHGSAVVVDKDRVVGIFTSVDALRALFALLEEERRERG